MGFTFPDCSAEHHSKSWDLISPRSGPGAWGSEAADMCSGTEPFPESSVIATIQGSAQEVQCFAPGKAADVDFCAEQITRASCTQAHNEGNAERAFPCPSPSFTSEQRDQQLMAHTVPGIFTLILSAAMVTCLFAMGAKNKNKVPAFARSLSHSPLACFMALLTRFRLQP